MSDTRTVTSGAGTPRFSSPETIPWRPISLSALLFTVVSLLAFSCWAYGSGIFQSDATLYPACAIVFLAGGGLALYPSAKGAKSLAGLFLTFLAGFAGYAICWCAGYFVFKGAFGEVMGSLAGVYFLCAIFRFSFHATFPLFLLTAGVFTLHTVGYYAGEFGYQHIKVNPENTQLARMVWGACYGAGFGAGLGWMIGRLRSSR